MNDDIHITPYIAAAVDDELRKIIVDNGKKVTLNKREFFLKQGTINSFVYVHSGLLGRIRDTPLEFKQTHLEIIPAGRVANFLNFFSPGKARISIQALRNSEIYLTPYKTVYAIMENDRRIAHEFEQMYGANMETALRSCYCNFIFSCESRLISLFRAMIRNYGIMPDGNGWMLLPYKLTREEYSQIIFSSLLTLDNILLQWKKEGVYKKAKEGSYIHQSLPLRSIAYAP
ncbi:Crp/Fnr family transcriptional regulator [Budvicia aquatica]|uniref:Crp/Fnr family transcriptional regulator n=1 Tax=Budvicia aquatica TaxID=82979 RepID=A0A2C6CPH4_9GAMM|nr:Crp/Fnr family transcriptional regulator [Budvicia aquatica]PHI28569.1 Crp/Fnr family transcriptional regulator [Budvicia aquatica]VFS46546.1 Uncharacterised protein [Budvicia aquatica]